MSAPEPQENHVLNIFPYTMEKLVGYNLKPNDVLG